jgi:hypothetical protein
VNLDKSDFYERETKEIADTMPPLGTSAPSWRHFIYFVEIR